MKEWILYAKLLKPNIKIIITMTSMDDLCVSPIYLYEFLVDLRDKGYHDMDHSFFHMSKSGNDGSGAYAPYVGDAIAVSFTDLILTYESLIANKYSVDDVKLDNVAFYMYMLPKWKGNIEMRMTINEGSRNSHRYRMYK